MLLNRLNPLHSISHALGRKLPGKGVGSPPSGCAPVPLVVASSGGMDAPQHDAPCVAKHDPGAGVVLS